MRFVFSLIVLVLSLDSTALALDPVASISIAGWDRAQADFQELSTLSEHPELVKKLRARLSAIPQLDGLDANGPAGAWMFMIDQNPHLGIAIPVTDFADVHQSLKARLNISLTAGNTNQDWTFSLPDRTIYIRAQGKFALITDELPILDRLSVDLLEQLSKDISEDDIAIRLDAQHLPREWVHHFLQQIQSEFEKDSGKRADESDREFKIREQFQELASTIATRVVEDTESITARLKIERGIQLAVDWKILDDSPLSDAVSDLPVEQKVPTPNENAAASLRLAITLPQEFKKILLDMEAIVRDHIRDKVGGHLLREDRMPAGEVFETFKATIEKGTIRGIIQFVPNTDGYMILLATLKMERISGLATSLKTVLPYARDDKKVKSVEFDIITTAEASIHRINGTTAKDEDRKIYGGVPALYVGTSSTAAWFAAGKKDTQSVLKDSLPHPGKTDSNLAAIHVSMMPWIKLAEKNGAHDDGFQLLKEAMTADTDELRATISAQDNTVSLQVNAESGYERLLGDIAWKLLRH